MKENNGEARSILLVDDSMFLRKRLRQALQDEGYRLVEADNGQAALSAIEQQNFDCVLTDLVMPRMDGFGLLAEIRKRGLPVPVVVITADIQKTTRDRCVELGASAFLQKPVDPGSLRSTISAMMQAR